MSVNGAQKSSVFLPVQRYAALFILAQRFFQGQRLRADLRPALLACFQAFLLPRMQTLFARFEKRANLIQAFIAVA